jgi:phosphoglycerate kinase
MGKKTIAHIKQAIESAKTIFFNGLPGFIDRKETLDGAQMLYNALADAQGNTIISGGDSIAVADMFNYANKMNHLSTGGGATLTYLSGKPLSGLRIFKK